jgi:hypothetical protein
MSLFFSCVLHSEYSSAIYTTASYEQHREKVLKYMHVALLFSGTTLPELPYTETILISRNILTFRTEEKAV